MVKYNKDPRTAVKIEKFRINIDIWGPEKDGGNVRVGIQIWIVGGWPTMSREQVEIIVSDFAGILGKELLHQKGFDISCYVQNVTIPSEDD